MWGMGVPAYPVSDDATVSITIVDEDGRFNLNQLIDGAGNAHGVTRERFRRLLASLDIDDPVALSDALIDWIDSGDVTSPRGAENSWYQGLTPPLACKNTPLDTVDELLLVKGFTAEIVQRLTPFVTVAGVASLNVNTASQELLLAWHKDLTAGGIDQLLTARQVKPFKSLTEVQAAIDAANYGNLMEQGGIAVTSKFYRITSVAQVNDGMRSVEALIEKAGNHLVWRRVY
jgi:general secretion pathway protein K